LNAANLHLRQATAQDQPEVIRVIKAVYDEYGFDWDPEGYHSDLYSLEESYAARGDFFYVGVFDGEVRGTAALEIFTEIPSGIVAPMVRIAGSDCSIERVYVDPLARRKGIGRALSEYVIAEAKGRGRRQMEIWTDKRFTEAHRLYQSLGAEIVAERLCDDPEQSPEWGMMLRLTD
jgi:putative acetyltransferase